ncbi:hypothetical protein N566_01730 [Streptomycetaceae bacterium MP113-05]|nr:hypothetical protein N566_01730 [Streptomycetaceae bacterium MP113-05]
MRLIVRRVKPSRRDAKKLTAFEKHMGWRHQIIATNIPAHHGLSGVPVPGQVWFLDAWTRLLLLHDESELATAEPETIRMKLYHLLTRLTTHARRRTLHLDGTWPWASAFATA